MHDTASRSFHDYMRDGFETIEGWPGRTESVLFLERFRALFEQHGERGGACEIGVHHGKYLIALHNLLTPSSSLGIDVFEDQGRNVDYSGSGSLEVCRRNVQRFAVAPETVHLMSTDSLTLTSREIERIREQHAAFALFSIDGGHTPLHTSHDFFTASQLASDRGIIIVDDLFHPDWPGVTEGLYSALRAKRAPFVPMFITRKKAFLCHVSVFTAYRDFSARSYSEMLSREVRFVDFLGWRIPSLNFGMEY